MKRIEQLQQLLQNSPNEPFILFALAKEYEKLQEQPQALKIYEQLRDNQPDYVGTYYHLGKLYEKLDRPAEAFKTYAKGMHVAQQAGDMHSRSELAGAKLALGDDDDFEL